MLTKFLIFYLITIGLCALAMYCISFICVLSRAKKIAPTLFLTLLLLPLFVVVSSFPVIRLKALVEVFSAACEDLNEKGVTYEKKDK